MLSDDDLENRRLALTTLNSAVKHKPATVLRNLSQLVPFVIKATTIDPSLIRDVQMGPFKHKVDDGLENRKASVSFRSITAPQLLKSQLTIT